MTLYAIPHDGTFAGDNQFHPSRREAIPWTGKPFNELMKRKLALLSLCGSTSDQELVTREEIECVMGVVKGVWIVSETVLLALDGLASADSRGDGACYAVNHAAKCMVDSMAIQHLGKRPLAKGL